MKKYIFTVFAVAAVLSSCSKNLELNEDINSEAKAITTIGASTEISTRAIVSSDGTKVNWEGSDQLGVLGTNSSSVATNLAYALTSGIGSTIGTFQNNSSDIRTISAIMYPYQENATWDSTNSKLTCEIPYVQTAVKGSFDKAAAVMYSIGNTTNVKLNYAVNFLKVHVTVEEKVHAISISSSNALSGKMEITSTDVTAASSGSLNSVSITAARGEVLQTGDYYIAVKKGDIADPTISYVYLDQPNHTATEKSKAGSTTLSFASGTNVKPISVDFTEGTVTTRKAVQLYANGPYFAEYNVGVTDSKAESYGGYYAWGKTTATGLNLRTDALSGADDTATNLWGSNWRMPTADELGKKDGSGNYVDGLLGKCTVAWTTIEGVSGREFTGKTDYSSSSVFLPAAGYNNQYQNSKGDYWSSTPNDIIPYYAYYLFFDSGNQGMDNENMRNNGYSVRAVLAK